MSLADTVAVAVDDFAPFAIEEHGLSWVRVYFSGEADRDAAQLAVGSLSGPRIQTTATSVPNYNWAARSQSDLKAIRVGRVVIAPPWDLPIHGKNHTEVVVEIRPALGFGSGHHPSTRLALLGLQQIDLRKCDVLDLGTGSGVLAVAAVKLGAQQATGIDRDPDALASARENAATNRVNSRVSLNLGNISNLGPDASVVTVANLTGAALIDLAPTISTVTKPGGHMVLSGILTEEEGVVVRAYKVFAHCVWRNVEDGWVGMVWERIH